MALQDDLQNYDIDTLIYNMIANLDGYIASGEIIVRLQELRDAASSIDNIRYYKHSEVIAEALAKLEAILPPKYKNK